MALILRRKLTYEPPHRRGDFAKLLPYYQHAHYYHRMMEVMNYVPNVGTDFSDAGYCLDRPDEPPLPEDGDILAELHEWGWTNFLAGIERGTREETNRVTRATANVWAVSTGRWSERRSQDARGPTRTFAIREGMLMHNNRCVRRIGSFGWVQEPDREVRDFRGHVIRVMGGRIVRYLADDVALDPREWTHVVYLDEQGRTQRIGNPDYRPAQGTDFRDTARI